MPGGVGGKFDALGPWGGLTGGETILQSSKPAYLKTLRLQPPSFSKDSIALKHLKLQLEASLAQQTDQLVFTAWWPQRGRRIYRIYVVSKLCIVRMYILFTFYIHVGSN